MSKEKIIYQCENCNTSTPKWQGQCHKCKSWNSLVEETSRIKKNNKRLQEKSNQSLLIKEVSCESQERVKTGIDEFDRVLGGGITKGSLILVGGEPGIGKSTLLTIVMDKLSKEENRILYISGEESVAQVANRAKRIGVKEGSFYILNESSLQEILIEIKRIRPSFVVLDSIQTTISEEVTSPAGSVSQVREVTHELMNQVKSQNISCFVVGHITKDGNIAGPKVLEHMVDTVLYFEGDQFGQYRIVRSIKNRFGSTNEIGLFEMKEEGLKEVSNPSKYFMNNSSDIGHGRSLSCILEGARPLFIENQALVVENKYGSGKRVTDGIDSNRVSMLIAIIEKHINLNLSTCDIYVNIAGGIKKIQRESDLSILASIISSYKCRSIPEGTVFIGEVGLSGEVRAVPQMEKRLNEMKYMNFQTLITSLKTQKTLSKGKYPFRIIGLKSVKEVENYL